MDNEKINKFIELVSEQMVILAGQVADLQASVTVLKSLAILDLNPEDPIDAAKQLQALEKTVLKLDPQTQEREQAVAAIEAVKLWKKHGGGKHEA
jgi:hypothetical protein